MIDQAAGLRARLSDTSRPPGTHAATTPLMVVGPEQCIATVRQLLQHWHEAGYRWVGEPGAWQLVPVSAQSSHLAALASQQPRWALWVDRDADAFRRGLATLTRLHQNGGPRRLLAVHHPGLPRRGLLDNLHQAAASRLGIDLLVLAR
ncbi:MAG: hypothetical protein ACLFSR_07530 [Halomonas sp.]